jgi:hypothetical protein
MPYALLMDKLRAALTSEAIASVKQENPELVERLNARGSLVDVAEEAVDLASHEREYLEAVPRALREGIRATIASAIEEDKAVHIGYSPGYDFEIRVWDYGRGVSVHLSGPYPPTFPRDGYTPPPSG